MTDEFMIIKHGNVTRIEQRIPCDDDDDESPELHILSYAEYVDGRPVRVFLCEHCHKKLGGVFVGGDLRSKVTSGIRKKFESLRE